MKPFQAPAILKVGAPTQDGGMRGRFETNELTDEEKLELLKYDGTFGYILFKPNSFSSDDIPTDDAQEDWTKSQELRYWIARLHAASYSQIEKETYYRTIMDKFINKVKATVKSLELNEKESSENLLQADN